MNTPVVFTGRWLLLGGVWLGIITVWILPTVHTSVAEQSQLTVSFLDVGQGDAIFIETPEGIQVLIDGGPDGSVVRALASVMSATDRHIDVVIATHPDKDHIAGLVDVMERFTVGMLVVTENHGDTDVAERYYNEMVEKDIPLLYARAGQRLALGASTTLQIFSPADNPRQWESNASSIVAQIIYGEASFLFTGDISVATEEFLVRQYGALLASDVLKLGHHGSRTSTSPLFANTIRPRYAVVSAGSDNAYGHPHPEPIATIEAAGATVVTTAEQGHVTFVTDGSTVWLDHPP